VCYAVAQLTQRNSLTVAGAAPEWFAISTTAHVTGFPST
jgi:hypothetical protein